MFAVCWLASVLAALLGSLEYSLYCFAAGTLCLWLEIAADLWQERHQQRRAR